MYKLQFDSEDEAQICLEIISEALEEAKRRLELYGESSLMKFEIKHLNTIKYKLEAMLEDE